jgi:hypothetical protein
MQAQDNPRQPHVFHWCTPPQNVRFATAGLLARGSLRFVRPSRCLIDISGCDGRSLAAYSCGGSPGIAFHDRKLTGFPFSFRSIAGSNERPKREDSARRR